MSEKLPSHPPAPLENHPPLDLSPKAPQEEASPALPDSGPTEPAETIEARRARLKKRITGLQSGEVMQLNINVVDVTPYIEQIAHRIAEEKVREYMNQKGLKRLIGGLIHLSEDGYRRAFYNEAMEAITSNRDVMASIEARVFGRGKHMTTGDGKNRTLDILDEVLRSVDEELIHEEQRGEKFVADEAVNAVVSAIFVDYATGVITNRSDFEARVEAEVVPFFKGHKFSQDGVKNAASEHANVMHATNLWRWAYEYQSQVAELVEQTKKEYGAHDAEQAKKHVAAILKMDIQLAKQARDIVNRAPEGKLNKVQKFVSSIQEGLGDHPVNRVLGWTFGNPVVHGIFGSLATRAGIRWAATGLAAVGLGAVAGPAGIAIAGAVGGATTAGMMAKWRAQKELKADRGMVHRDIALGKEPGGPRATKMKEFVHDLYSVDGLLKELRAIDISGEKLNEDDAKTVAHVYALLDVEREHMIDTISASNTEGNTYNSKLFSLHNIQRELKKLRGFGEKNPEIEQYRSTYKAELLKQIRSRDEAFDEHMKRESRKRALQGAAIGLAGAGIMAGASHAFPEAGQWVGEKMSSAVSGVKRLWSYMWGGSDMPPVESSLDGVVLPPLRSQNIFYAGGTLRLSPDQVMVQDGAGHAWITTRSGERITDSFAVSSHGEIIDATDFTKKLSEAGIHMNHAVETTTGVDYSETMHTISHGTFKGEQQFELPENVVLDRENDGSVSLYDKTTGKVLESGLRVNESGVFDEKSLDVLREHGWNIEQDSRIISESLHARELDRYLDEHFDQKKIKRLDWHSNGTPLRKVGEHWVVTGEGIDEPITSKVRPIVPDDGSMRVRHVAGRWVGADGKELMLRLQGEKGNRVLSLKEMIHTSIGGPRNPDGTFDTKFGNISDETYKKQFADAASNFKLRVFVGDNYWKSGKAFDIPVGPDGEFTVKSTDPLYGVLFDEKGNLKATVEAVVHDKSGKGYHTLATAVRHGDGAGVVTRNSSYVRMTHGDELVERDVYTTSEWQRPQDDPFYFVTPFFQRKPMERPRDPAPVKSVESNLVKSEPKEETVSNEDGKINQASSLEQSKGSRKFKLSTFKVGGIDNVLRIKQPGLKLKTDDVVLDNQGSEAVTDPVVPQGASQTDALPEQSKGSRKFKLSTFKVGGIDNVLRIKQPGLKLKTDDVVLDNQGPEVVTDPEVSRELLQANTLLEQYMVAHDDIALDEQEQLRDRFVELMASEDESPTDWEQPIFLDGKKGDFVEQVREYEMRVLASGVSPESISFVLTTDFLVNNKITDPEAVTREYQAQLAHVFAIHGVPEVRVGWEGVYGGGNEYPLARPAQISEISLRKIPDVSVESGRMKLFKPVYEAARKEGTIIPLLWVLEKQAKPQEIAQFKIELEAVMKRVSAFTGKKFVYLLTTNDKEKNSLEHRRNVAKLMRVVRRQMSADV